MSSANELHLHLFFSGRWAERVYNMITAKDLSFSYTGSPPYVLHGLNLEINDGEYVSVVGENGCGKSTLMRLILKFLKPTGGSITNKATRVGYVPQKSDYSNAGFPITVYEALDSYRRLLKLHDKGVIEAGLRQVGMQSFAGALMGAPDLLILDEPSTGVDIQSQQEIYGFLKGINQNNGITIVSVEHNLDAAVSNSTLIYHLTDGRGHLCSPKKYAQEFLGGKIGQGGIGNAAI